METPFGNVPNSWPSLGAIVGYVAGFATLWFLFTRKTLPEFMQGMSLNWLGVVAFGYIAAATALAVLLAIGLRPKSTDQASDVDAPILTVYKAGPTHSFLLDGGLGIAAHLAIGNKGARSDAHDWYVEFVNKKGGTEELSLLGDLRPGITVLPVAPGLGIAADALLPKIALRGILKNEAVAGWVVGQSMSITEDALPGGYMVIKFRDGRGIEHVYQTGKFPPKP